MALESKFNFDITYVKEELHKVVDCLSCYYKSDTSKNVHHIYDYVCASTCIDPEGDDLPQCILELVQQVEQLHTCMDQNLVHPTWLSDRKEPCD